MKIILYSTNCPKCNVIKKKLSTTGLDFEVVTDVDLMIKKGFMSAPVLEVDGEIMDFKNAVDWIAEIQK